MKLTNKCVSLDNISVEEFQLISLLNVYRDQVTEQDVRHIFPTKALFEAQKHFLATNYPHAVFFPLEHSCTYARRSHQLRPSDFQVAIKNLAKVLAVSFFC